MLKRTLALIAVGAFVSSALTHADPTVEDILNKHNRVLPPPPSNIKSNRFDPSERFDSALERSQSAVALDGKRSTASDADGSSSVEVVLGNNKKIRDRFGAIGVMGGGQVGLVGAQGALSIPYVWLLANLGSGVNYTSWGTGIRKYLFPDLAILPFIDLRYNEWILKQGDEGKTNGDYPFPSYATERFFKNPWEKQTAHLLSPGLGMAMVDREGFGLEMGAQYLYSMDLSRGAFLGSLGLTKYF